MSYLPHAAKYGVGNYTGIVKDVQVRENPGAPPGSRFVIYCSVDLTGVTQPPLRNVRYTGSITLRIVDPTLTEPPLVINQVGGLYDQFYLQGMGSPYLNTHQEITRMIVGQLVGRSVIAQVIGGRWMVN